MSICGSLTIGPREDGTQPPDDEPPPDDGDGDQQPELHIVNFVPWDIGQGEIANAITPSKARPGEIASQEAALTTVENRGGEIPAGLPREFDVEARFSGGTPVDLRNITGVEATTHEWHRVWRCSLDDVRAGETVGCVAKIQTPPDATSVEFRAAGAQVESTVTQVLDVIPNVEQPPDDGADDRPGIGCQSTEGCPTGSICVDGRCVSEGTGGGCQGNQDCPEGEECAGGTCVPVTGGCDADADCAEGEICVNNSCVPLKGGAPPGDGVTPQPDGPNLQTLLIAGAGLTAAGVGAWWLTQQENGRRSNGGGM